MEPILHAWRFWLAAAEVLSLIEAYLLGLKPRGYPSGGRVGEKGKGRTRKKLQQRCSSSLQ
jgi:hypothetical protein